MIDRYYGHLARDGHEHAISLVGELSAGQGPRWTLVDAAWTSKLAAAASVDNERSTKERESSKPSSGLEPETPSLPWNNSGNWSQPRATVLA
jgi:hypothetical protein